MSTYDLYSKRQKRLRGEFQDVYSYDDFPQTLKVQIVHIWNDAIGEKKEYSKDLVADVYKAIRDTLCREYGVFELHRSSRYDNEVINFFLNEDDVELSLDVVELAFKLIDTHIRTDRTYRDNTNIIQQPDDAIYELNERFKEHALGFQFESGKIIRVDSTYTHSEIVKPLLSLIGNRKFSGVNEEYLKAHEHYRLGRNKECLVECLKAFESTMKVICIEKGWSFDEGDSSKKLINICLQNNLVPTYTQNQFSSLRTLLESGIPTIRNKLGGHGQGQNPQKVDDEMTRYALNLTGTNIIFLIEQSGV